MDRLVSLDQGSSSSRALLIERGGRILRRAQTKVRTSYPQAGWVEHDPADIWTSTERSLRSVLTAKRPPDALALAAQRSTVVFWDAKTGETAGKALSWQDGRAAAFTAALTERQSWVHEKTGLYLTPYYAAPKIAWALKHDAEVRKLADAGRLRLGPVSTFLVWKLTQGAVFAADPTQAQRTLLLDIETLDWDEELLKAFGVPRDALPEVRASRADWGSYLWKGGRLPILATLGDQQAAALGLGAAAEGRAALNYGTGAFLLLHTGERRPKVPGLLASIAWQEAGAAPQYLVEGTVHAAATSFEWLRSNLGLLRSTREIERLWLKSKRRVWALPAIGGLGAPRWDYKTRSSFFGLDSQTRREDLVRAVGEALAFLLADIGKTAEAAGFPLRDGVAAGGLSRVTPLVAFQAGLLGCALRVSEEKEATALGAARLAGLELDAARAGEPVAPSVAPEEAARLHAFWRTYVSSLQELSRSLPA